MNSISYVDYNFAETLASTATGHWGRCPPLDFHNLFFFRLTSQLHEAWETMWGCLSKYFVFCNSSCGSSVAATWTLFGEFKAATDGFGCITWRRFMRDKIKAPFFNTYQNLTGRVWLVFTLSLYGIIYVTWYTRHLPKATRVRFR